MSSTEIFNQLSANLDECWKELQWAETNEECTQIIAKCKAKSKALLSEQPTDTPKFCKDHTW